ncbi:MAG: MlaA family lipoprotein [Pseudomonadota bacterium]
MMRITLAVVAALSLSACAHSPPDEPSDPLEPVNRAFYSFNRGADRYILKPIAKGYDAITPTPVRRGVSNFFENLKLPTTIVNDVLQLKFHQAGKDTARLVLNSTFGIGGLIDIGPAVDLPLHEEDFGQTLGYWGVGEGIYLMLPFIGPSNGRDVIGRVADTFTSVTGPPGVTGNVWLDMPTEHVAPAGFLEITEKRAQYFAADPVLDKQFDEYVFVRSVYLQKRQSLIYDGSPPKEEQIIIDETDREEAPQKKPKK